jgi:hypothetical protein
VISFDVDEFWWPAGESSLLPALARMDWSVSLVFAQRGDSHPLSGGSAVLARRVDKMLL